MRILERICSGKPLTWCLVFGAPILIVLGQRL
jgi:hypothetical protein